MSPWRIEGFHRTAFHQDWEPNGRSLELYHGTALSTDFVAIYREITHVPFSPIFIDIRHVIKVSGAGGLAVSITAQRLVLVIDM